jgi:predicted TIM-barrel fold metal-dependent hydrolase
MVVDCHVHVYPHEVERKVIPKVESVYGVRARHPATVEGVRSAMKKAGIEKSLVLSYLNRPEHVVSFNTWCAEVQKTHKELLFFGGMHPDFEMPLEELERIKGLGLLGIKLQPNTQRFYPDDERFFPIYEMLVELDLAVAFHCGDEVIHFDQMYAHPSRFAQVLESFPDLTILLAHLGGYKTWDAIRYVAGYESVWYDTAFCPRNLLDKEFREIVDRLGSEKVVFGTDFPWTDQATEKKEIERIFKEDAVKILEENPKKLLAELSLPP